MNLILPFLPENLNGVLNVPCDQQDMQIYRRFMRHLGYVSNSKIEIKILSALQFTADILDLSDAHVSKVLVDLGLRASREAFPAEFLQFAQRSLVRQDCEVGGPSLGVLALARFWGKEGAGACISVVSFDRWGLSFIPNA